MKSIKLLSLLVLVVGFVISCNKKDDNNTKTGLVKLQMAVASLYSMSAKSEQITPFATCPSWATCLTPTSFQMKILAAYVVEDVDPQTSNNVGQVGMVWLNPACASINDCKPSMVAYSDLTNPTEFNASLNSQALAISTGTYKYVRLEFCQGSADANNVKVTVSGTTKEFTYGGCGSTSVALANPVIVEEGSSLTIAVTYDLTVGTVYWASGGGSCPSATDFCLGGIDLTPSIVQ